MQGKHRSRNAVLTGAAALGMALGSVGIGWAISPSATPAVAPTVQVSQATGHSGDKALSESQEGIEAPEAEEAPEANEVNEINEVQDPSYATSITAPQDEGVSEADEAKALESLATITPDQARNAALEAVPGTAGKVELDNENGAVVYSVEVTDSSGSGIDVKVDAGNGTVVHQDADDGDNEG